MGQVELVEVVEGAFNLVEEQTFFWRLKHSLSLMQYEMLVSANIELEQVPFEKSCVLHALC